MLLEQYIGVKDNEAIDLPLATNNVKNLCKSDDYVIEKYRQATTGKNYYFSFKIYQFNQEVSSLQVGKWKLEHIRSYPAWRPKYLYFDLIDPDGKNSSDKTLPYCWIYNGDETIRVHDTGILGFNSMLQLAKEASEFDYWLAFIKAKFEQHVLAKENDKYLKLEEEYIVLKGKLTSIETILNT